MSVYWKPRVETTSWIIRAHHSKSCKICADTTCTEYAFIRTIQSEPAKTFGKIRFGSKLSLGLYGLSFRIQAASYFPQSWVQKTGLVFYLADFDGYRNWHIPSFYENKTKYWALFSTKTNQGRFYFHCASLSRAEDLAAVNHVTQAVVRVGSKIES